MSGFIHTQRVQQRMLSVFVSLTDLYSSHHKFKVEPSQSALDALTQAAADFETKVEMIRQTIAMSVKEIAGQESEEQVEGRTTSDGIEL